MRRYIDIAFYPLPGPWRAAFAVAGMELGKEKIVLAALADRFVSMDNRKEKIRVLRPLLHK